MRSNNQRHEKKAGEIAAAKSMAKAAKSENESGDESGDTKYHHIVEEIIINAAAL